MKVPKLQRLADQIFRFSVSMVTIGGISFLDIDRSWCRIILLHAIGSAAFNGCLYVAARRAPTLLCGISTTSCPGTRDRPTNVSGCSKIAS